MYKPHKLETKTPVNMKLGMILINTELLFDSQPE